MQRLEVNIITGEIIVVDIPIEEQPPAPAAGELMSKELSDLSTQYKMDLSQLNTSYLAVLAADGVNEETKKAVIRNEIATRKATYLADMTAVKAKYQ